MCAVRPRADAIVSGQADAGQPDRESHLRVNIDPRLEFSLDDVTPDVT